MIKDQTIDEALIEIMRTKKTLEALRKFRKTCDRRCPNNSCKAAAKRASLDLTRKLADLRAGR